MTGPSLNMRRYRDQRVREVKVPSWVPESLVKEFMAVADVDGEHAAAKWARAEKKKLVSK